MSLLFDFGAVPTAMQRRLSGGRPRLLSDIEKRNQIGFSHNKAETPPSAQALPPGTRS
ncbi:uncharacterized protein TrAtP1_010894 [Trichoderma atroviride]|uniref:uncharacterized protein n=1 Tax=Hypocrea atroviridis TaxID=63577 RepID=UPI003318A400|nr:hypothetical protein TrAtP1_010894 [Trichoderma atroviride]